ncbi:hypothetical protein KCP71_20060 [Salmonella enterica subsp. enterica]|nr:hypothetical protein KCP71_20060 [Salmonella enterica subsp. enterica]
MKRTARSSLIIFPATSCGGILFPLANVGLISDTAFSRAASTRSTRVMSGRLPFCGSILDIHALPSFSACQRSTLSVSGMNAQKRVGGYPTRRR